MDKHGNGGRSRPEFVQEMLVDKRRSGGRSPYLIDQNVYEQQYMAEKEKAS